MTEEQLVGALATRPVYKLTGPPEHWLTTYNMGFWGLTQDWKSMWQGLAPGNLCVFHSTGTDYVSMRGVNKGIIGVGRVTRTSTKETLEWYHEIDRNVNKWPYLIHFSPIWWFGRTDQIDDESIRVKMKKGDEHLKSDIARLTQNYISFQDMTLPDGKRLIAAQGSIATVKKSEGFQPLIERRLKESTTVYPSGEDPIPDTGESKDEPGPVQTGEYRTTTSARLGQDEFSQKVRDNYDHHCCFPGCNVADDQYLIGSHIARWTDNPEMRGDVANGLCLCLFHDKGFEVGHFTIGPSYTVQTRESQVENSPWAREHVLPHVGEAIDEGNTPPHPKALQEHWERNGFAFE